MSSCIYLEEIDLSELINITHIGNQFMIMYIKIGEINLSGLRNLTSVGNISLFQVKRN